MRETETATNQPLTAESAREMVTGAANQTIDVLKGHLSPEERSNYEKVLENLNGARAWFSRNRLRMTSSLALAVTFLTSCAPAVGPKPTETIAQNQPVATETIQPPKETATATATEAPTAIPTKEIKKYDLCTNIENFRDYPIPVEDLLDGTYHAYLRTLSKPFPENIKILPMEEVAFGAGPEIIYQVKTAPNYKDKTIAPFRRNVTCGYTSIEKDGKEYKYIVTPVEYADPSDPTNPDKNSWIIGLIPLYDEKGLNPNDIIEFAIKIWLNKMRIAPLIETTRTQYGIEDPLENQMFKNDPKMPDHFKEFLKGNIKALDGKIVLLDIAINSANWYGDLLNPQQQNSFV